MRAVLTRVTSASVAIDGKVKGQIGKGFLVLLGVHKDDTEAEAERIADRICGLRIFEDENGKMNVNPADAGAEILIISQFTLFADTRSRRPGFTAGDYGDFRIRHLFRVIRVMLRNSEREFFGWGKGRIGEITASRRGFFSRTFRAGGSSEFKYTDEPENHHCAKNKRDDPGYFFL